MIVKLFKSNQPQIIIMLALLALTTWITGFVKPASIADPAPLLDLMSLLVFDIPILKILLMVIMQSGEKLRVEKVILYMRCMLFNLRLEGKEVMGE